MKSKQKRRTWLIMPLLSLLVLIASCVPHQEEEIIELEEPVSVAVLSTTVSRGDLFDASVVDGYVVPLTQEIQMETNAIAGHLEVFLGQHVEKGQVLLELDVEKTQKEAEKLAKQLEYQKHADELANQQKELTISIAQKELERLQYYGYASSLITKKELEIEELELELKQQIEMQALQIQKLQQAKTEKMEELQVHRVLAPAAGTVVYIAPIRQGDRLQRLDVVFVIAMDDQYLIETDFVPQSSFDMADRVEARIGARSYELEYQPMDPKEYISRKLAGKVVHSFYSIPSEEASVVSGEYVAVIFYNRIREQVLVIPSSAVYQDEAGRYVYVMQEDGSRSRREVTIGVTTRTGYEVTGGLMEGERVYVKE